MEEGDKSPGKGTRAANFGQLAGVWFSVRDKTHIYM